MHASPQLASCACFSFPKKRDSAHDRGRHTRTFHPSLSVACSPFRTSPGRQQPQLRLAARQRSMDRLLGDSAAQSTSLLSSSSGPAGDHESLEIVIFTAGLFFAVLISIFVSYSHFFRSVCHTHTTATRHTHKNGTPLHCARMPHTHSTVVPRESGGFAHRALCRRSPAPCLLHHKPTPLTHQKLTTALTTPQRLLPWHSSLGPQSCWSCSPPTPSAKCSTKSCSRPSSSTRASRSSSATSCATSGALPHTRSSGPLCRRSS